jgi:hypothetical protein
MAVNLMDTALGGVLRNAQTISFPVIWRAVFQDVKFKTMILDWIRWDQLYSQGVDEFGAIIGYYSEWTEIINPSKVAGTPFTLYDTGDFYRSLYIYVTNDSFFIDGQSIKTDEDGGTKDLFVEYGQGIVGLTDENKTRLANELITRFQTEYERLLFGNR